MQGELAQLISLTSYGNEYLASGNLPLFYYPEHHTFQYCRVVEFVIPGDNVSPSSYELVWAENPLLWFEKLKQEGCTGLKLSYQPADRHPLAQEHQLVAFIGGGGQWLIETQNNGRAQYWLKRWELTNKEDPDQKIWTVHYARVEANVPLINQHFDIEEIKAEFESVLTALIRFCKHQDLPQWGSIFLSGKNMLTSLMSLPENHQLDLLVNKNYSQSAQQLMYAVDEIWVFGGMGSWNDIGFEEGEVQKEYDELSGRLYAVMMKGIIAVVNSFCP
jgi:hypothetical protein